ncbi:MAG TPA: cytochrome c [Telmatospirillum sp.]|nr:cytochrome c [Telmatospirillum sp.]
MTRNRILLVATLTSLCFGSGVALADTDADAAIAYRKSVMQLIGTHTKDIAAIVKGTVPFSSDLAFHAEGLAGAAAIALKPFEDKVVEGKDEKTTAKADIWSNFPHFADTMHKLEADTAALKVAVNSGDKAAIGSQLGVVGKDCKSCHDDSRTK